MQGYSGSFAVNGVNFQLQPTKGKWDSREVLGIDGNGHPIYPMFREFEVTWQLASPSDVDQIENAYLAVSNTGTAVFDLPKWGDANYLFYSYSGCTMREPEVGEYFNGYFMDVRLTIMQVRTN